MLNKNQIAESFVTFTNNELVSLNKLIVEEITRRKEEEEQKKTRLREEQERLVNDMNLMLRQFREIAGELNRLKEKEINCYVQGGINEQCGYLDYGQYPFYGFDIDGDGDLMAVCDIDHPRAKWWRDKLNNKQIKN